MQPTESIFDNKALSVRALKIVGVLYDRQRELPMASVQGQRVGYVRVSVLDQRTERQLEPIPVDRIFTDQVAAKNTQRPHLAALLTFVRDGDTVVVHSMDRLARNLEDLRRLLRELTARGVRAL
jgi:predicted site-specific integrase-resolvase